jgi:(p)ppGpp synthase/HD superfamily hydrolase
MTEPAIRLSERYTAAVDHARLLHAADVRKGTGVPYLAHLLTVSALVLEHGGDEDLAIAALLHDAAEDHGGRPQLDEIRRRWGDRVADVVEACSDTLVSDPTTKEPWHDRKRAYLDRLPHEPIDALVVVAADKLHNARTLLADHRRLGDRIWSRFTTGDPDDQLWYYSRVVELTRARLEGHEASAMVDELGDIVTELRRRLAS